MEEVPDLFRTAFNLLRLNSLRDQEDYLRLLLRYQPHVLGPLKIGSTSKGALQQIKAAITDW